MSNSSSTGNYRSMLRLDGDRASLASGNATQYSRDLNKTMSVPNLGEKSQDINCTLRTLKKGKLMKKFAVSQTDLGIRPVTAAVGAERRIKR